MCPRGSPSDHLLLLCIQCAHFDTLWAWEPSIIGANLRECKHIISLGNILGIDEYFVTMGPFPLEGDVWGIRITMITLMCTLGPVKYANHVQFRTAHWLRNGFLNVYHASYHGLGMAVMAKDAKKTYVTTCPSYGL